MIRDSKKRDEMATKYASLMTDPLKFVKIDNANYKPDVFVVGPKHIAYASNHHGGMLGEETCEAIPCCGCGKPLSAHTYDTVVFIEVTRKCTQAEVQAVLTKEVGKMAGEDGIDGFAFPKGWELIEKT